MTATVHTLTIPRRSINHDLRKGDVIVSIDGRSTHFTVRARPEATGPILVDQPGRVTGLDLRIYPDTNITDSVTVERPVARRRVGPVTMLADGDRYWVSEDGRYTLEYTVQGWTECENPHPTGEVGGYCTGGQPHTWSAWQVWDEKTGDYVARAEYSYREAARLLAAYAADRAAEN